jgi:hypothetical protein
VTLGTRLLEDNQVKVVALSAVVFNIPNSFAVLSFETGDAV